MSSFDTPGANEVFQEDVIEPVAVPVKIEGVLATDEMPSEIGAIRNIVMRLGANAEQILTRDKRRKSVVMWVDTGPVAGGVDGVCIASTSYEAQNFDGAILWASDYSFNRYRFEIASELWARPVIRTYTGSAWTGYTVSTSDIILSVVTEQWAR